MITEKGKRVLLSDSLWKGNGRDLQVLEAISEGKNPYLRHYPEDRILDSLRFLKEMDYIKKGGTPMEFTLEKDKTTPGTVRYKETGDVDRPLTLYLTKDRVKELGDPESIKVTIEAES